MSGFSVSTPAPAGRTDSTLGAIVNRVGAVALAVCHEVGGLTKVGIGVLGALLHFRIDRRELLRHLDRFATDVIGLVVGGGVIVGGVVAMQGLHYIDRYNATEVFGWAAGLSSFREVGPLLVGMILASRLGSKNTAELASMVARERIDALAALGLSPLRVVVAPRAVAIFLASALLFPVATGTIFFSSLILASIVGDQLLAVSWYSMTEYLHASEVIEGFLRMSLFGAFIGVASSALGLRGGTDARAIGRNVYTSAVTTLSGVVVLNLYLSFFFSG